MTETASDTPAERRWEITPAELRRLRVALDRLGGRDDLDAALDALAGWALALIDASAILVALRQMDGRQVVRAAAGRDCRRLIGATLDEAAMARRAGREAWLRVPIVVRTDGPREVGAVVARPRRGQRFLAADAEIVRLLAGQAGLAVRQHEADRELTRLYARERRRADQLQATAELTRRIVRLGRLGDVLDFAASALKSRFGYDRVAIYLRDGDDDALVLRAAAGLDAPIGQPLDQAAPTPAAWAARSGEPQLVRHSSELETAIGFDGSIAELAVPITLDRRPTGVLSIASASRDGLDAGDLALAESIADDLAIAIENLRLSGQVRADAAAAERARLARELHDETAQQLVAIGRRIELIRMRGAEDRDGQLAATQSMVDDALANLRRISRNLRPSLLEELGLVAAIEALVADQTRGGAPDAHFRVFGRARPLPPTVELALYRIAQEALGNALRHAGASRVRVELRFGEDARLEIADDGRGLVTAGGLAQLERAGGMGLIGMRDRAAEVGGRLEIVSTPGRGTVVRVVVPGT